MSTTSLDSKKEHQTSEKGRKSAESTVTPTIVGEEEKKPEISSSPENGAIDETLDPAKMTVEEDLTDYPEGFSFWAIVIALMAVVFLTALDMVYKPRLQRMENWFGLTLTEYRCNSYPKDHGSISQH
jgi:hypothetical protein